MSPVSLAARRRQPPDQFRLVLYHTVLFGLFGLVLAVTAWLQLRQDEYYRLQSRANCIQAELLPARRGTLCDVTGIPLVRDRVRLNAVLAAAEAEPERRAALLARVSELTSIPAAELGDRLDRAGKRLRRFQPRPLLEDLTPEQLAKVELFAADLPGLATSPEFTRDYLQGTIAAHLLGYMNELTAGEYDELKSRGYRLGSWWGRTGVEKFAEEYLRGADGVRWVEVDSRQRRVRTLERPAPLEPRDGANVHLTLDLRLQQAAERAFPPGRSGAVVGIDPRNGKVRLLISRPGYDPNAFTARRRDEVVRYQTAAENCLFDRAISGQYPAGSTFKIVDALAGLASGKASAQTVFSCGGSIALGNTVFKCWSAGGHGALTMIDAIRQSCNVYFYRLGLHLGPELIAGMSRDLGLGRPSHIELPGEAPGLVPDPDWKRREGRRLGLDPAWKAGDTANLAIGQGALLVTPLQMCNLIAAVANGGLVYRPQAVDRVIRPDGQVLYQFAPEIESKLELPASVWQTIRDGLMAVVKSGTGRQAAFFPTGDELAQLPAGKTGTAQVGDFNGDGKMDPGEEPHAWFVAYWPATEPVLALAVFVEHGGYGGTVAAPVAREIFTVLDREGMNYE